MDAMEILRILLRVIGNSKKIPQLSEVYSLNGQDYFVVHSNEQGKGVKISAENALVPVDLIVRKDFQHQFPMPGNVNKIYVTEQDPVALYFWDQYLGNYVLVAGGNDKNYVHDQGTPAEVWVVDHNLNKHPAVTVIDTAGNEVEGSTNYTGLNSLTITFNAPFSGTATLN